ncbi:MAG: chemotaxis protein CheW [Gammaproteobacteria bacterium]|nr:chemotaxis protein CheW [Gammaproteobacteria bacterium]
MNLPSEVLNREFVLEDTPAVEQAQAAEKFQVITTHGVVLGNIGLLMPADRVSELIENLSICCLPNTPLWFQGIASVRGNMIPVFDLHELLGIPVLGKGQGRKIITIDSGEAAAAFWVDDMPRLVMVTSDDRMDNVPPLPPLISDNSRSYYLKDGQIWIDWDVESFFTALGNLM